ncbi:hypothetical protein Ancab_007912 [Ancistrocladus abbreviatus]
MVRTPTFENGLKKGAWSPEEDNILRNYIRQNGHSNWRELPKSAGLARCGKSCRLRWVNYLQPGVKRGNYTKEEEDLILKLHTQLGNKWSKIAAKLPGRTDNEIKNHWHTHLKKRRREHVTSNTSPGEEKNHQANKMTGNSAYSQLPLGNIAKEVYEMIGLQILESSQPLSRQPSSSTTTEFSTLSSETLRNDQLELNASSMEGSLGSKTAIIYDEMDDWNMLEIDNLSEIWSQLEQPSNITDYSYGDDGLLELDSYDAIRFMDGVIFSPCQNFYDENVHFFSELMQDP